MKRHFEILVIDDDPNTLEVCCASLEHQGYQVAAAASAEAAGELLRRSAYDLIITDYRLKGQEDFGIYHQVRVHNPKSRVIILTADHDADAVVRALRLGTDDYMFKPYDIAELWDLVARHLHECAAECQSAAAPRQFPALNEEILKMLWIMTHDIKDSLTSMATTLASLHKDSLGVDGEGACRKLNELYSRAKRLIGMTEDFMGKATSVNGEVEIEHEEMDLREDVVDPVLDELCTELRESNIAIDNQLDVMPTNHIPVMGNTTWLRTVFRNLLKNAISYGGKGCTVAIGIQDNASVFRVNVFNSGSPVPAQDRDRLFSKFGRIASNGGSRCGSGVGLGLYLTKEILRKHGGDIWYEAYKHGSNFVFTIPRNS
jgi:signal transduction histidine kinase